MCSIRTPLPVTRLTKSHRNKLQHTATHARLHDSFSHTGTLQHNATQCNTQQHTAALCSTANAIRVLEIPFFFFKTCSFNPLFNLFFKSPKYKLPCMARVQKRESDTHTQTFMALVEKCVCVYGSCQKKIERVRMALVCVHIWLLRVSMYV